jgi:hypothetical protein
MVSAKSDGMARTEEVRVVVMVPVRPAVGQLSSTLVRSAIMLP